MIGRYRVLALLVAIAASTQARAAFSQTAAEDMMNNVRIVQELQRKIALADRNGDYEAAVDAAEQCMKASVGKIIALHNPTGNPICVGYLSKALINGNGVPRDEQRGLALLKGLAATYPDSGDIDLAEAYLDGVAAPPNPIEAAVLYWRVSHGAWSIYGANWGACDECSSLIAKENALRDRLLRELTYTQRQQAAAIAAKRYPDIEARVEWRNGEMGAAFLLVVGGILWWRVRSRKGHTGK